MIKLIGYGNPARGDDGLGPAFADAMHQMAIEGLEVRTDYQLSVDHAFWISDADRVLFVDASMEARAPFEFSKIAPQAGGALTSHALQPATVLTLTQTLYGARPEAFMLGITGFTFGDIRDGLSAGASSNLLAAKTFLHSWIMTRLAADAAATGASAELIRQT